MYIGLLLLYFALFFDYNNATAYYYALFDGSFYAATAPLFAAFLPIFYRRDKSGFFTIFGIGRTMDGQNGRTKCVYKNDN